jgi:tRNA(Glu) U13 pseudouridine synthase TruD
LRPGISIAKDLKVFVFGKTVFMSFFLNSGSYATVFVREIVKPKDPEGCGF